MNLGGVRGVEGDHDKNTVYEVYKELKIPSGKSASS